MDNLFTKGTREPEAARLMRMNDKEDFTHEDMSDPRSLNQQIWFAVRGNNRLPEVARLPLFDVMHEGVMEKTTDDDGDAGELAEKRRD